MIKGVHIGPLNFEVEYRNEIAYEDDGTEVPIQACCCMDSQIITISKVPTRVMQQKYLIHEMLEAYNKLYGLNLEHDMIDRLETIFYDMAASNPHFMEEIMERQ